MKNKTTIILTCLAILGAYLIYHVGYNAGASEYSWATTEINAVLSDGSISMAECAPFNIPYGIPSCNEIGYNSTVNKANYDLGECNRKMEGVSVGAEPISTEAPKLSPNFRAGVRPTSE